MRPPEVQDSRLPVQFLVKAQFLGSTVTESIPVNPFELNEPSSRWVNVWPPASGPKTAFATKRPSS